MTQRQVDSTRPLRFGTRGSALALAQASMVVDRFTCLFPGQRSEIVVIQTEGDRDRASPLTEIGGLGVFSSALESAALDGKIDAAVHSAKDVPTVIHPEVPIVAFPSRDDPRDVLVSRHQTTLDRLPANPVIGTSSRRRAVQILRLRPDARIVNIRGNIDTRLRKAMGTEFDAIVLAAAGLNRMGWGSRASEIFAVEQIVPSPGQGAIAIQARRGSAAERELTSIDDPFASGSVVLERKFLAAAGAGCATPIGAFVSANECGYRLVAMLASQTGDKVAFADEQLTTKEDEGHIADIALRMKAEIGESKTDAWSGWNPSEGDLSGVRVVVTRPRDQAGQLIATLADRGAEPLSLPTIRIEPMPDAGELDEAIIGLSRGGFDWIAFTSANAVAAVSSRRAALEIEPAAFATVKVAAVGQATARAAIDAGFQNALRPAIATAEGLAAAMLDEVTPSERVLYPRSAIGNDVLAERLRDAGIAVETVDAYTTVPEPDIDFAVLHQLRSGEVDAIVFTSPSTVRHLMALVEDVREILDRVSVFCVGPVTEKSAIEAGLTVTRTSSDPSGEAIADLIAAHLLPRNRKEEHKPHWPLAESELLMKGISTR